MTVSQLRKILWVSAAVATAGLVWLLLLPVHSFHSTRGEGTEAPPFVAEFELTDHQGVLRTEGDYAGRWLLVFFGFGSCPDVCPTMLAEIAAVMSGLATDRDAVQPLFISIDPERDTPRALGNLVPRFEAGIVGLTGTPDQVARTAESFKVYYEKIEEAAAPGGYTMRHSSELFLFEPSGGYVKAWQYGTPAEEILTDLRERIDR